MQHNFADPVLKQHEYKTNIKQINNAQDEKEMTSYLTQYLSQQHHQTSLKFVQSLEEKHQIIPIKQISILAYNYQNISQMFNEYILPNMNPNHDFQNAIVVMNYLLEHISDDSKVHRDKTCLNLVKILTKKNAMHIINKLNFKCNKTEFYYYEEYFRLLSSFINKIEEVQQKFAKELFNLAETRLTQRQIYVESEFIFVNNILQESVVVNSSIEAIQEDIRLNFINCMESILNTEKILKQRALKDSDFVITRAYEKINGLLLFAEKYLDQKSKIYNIKTRWIKLYNELTSFGNKENERAVIESYIIDFLDTILFLQEKMEIE